LFGLGRSKKDAKVAADLAEAVIGTITDAEAVGRFEPLPEADLFDLEYWSLEQPKLGIAKEPPLARQVAVITGAAGAIGFATAKAFAAAGAEVALLDVDEAAVQAKAKSIGGAALGIRCDVIDAASVKGAFARVASAFGGVDIVVSNAGAAWQGRIGEVDEAVLRVDELVQPWAGNKIDKVVAIEARGLILGGALAHQVSAGFVPIRKKGKLPHTTVRIAYSLEYGLDEMEMHADAVHRGERVILVDDLIATGGTAEGAIKLLRQIGANVVAPCFVIDLPDLGGTAKLRAMDVPVQTLMPFEGH
jgi:adenine phosphoribosyltransferase